MYQKLDGFTLIELVIVILILGIVGVGAYIRWPGISVNVDAQAAVIASDIRYTQTLAMTQGQRFRFVKTSATTYQILDNAGTAVTFSNGDTTITLGNGITFGTFSNLPNDLIAFDGSGIPYTDTLTPGTALTSTATIPLVSTDTIKNISISPETGRVTIS